MRKQIMDSLRKAGTKINAFDQKYADAVKQRVHGGDHSGTKGLIGDILGARAGDVEINEEALNLVPLLAQLGARGTQYGIPAAGYAARYAVPAVGITLAGKGLFDLSQGLYAMAAETPVFGGPEDGAQPGQLPLY